MEGWGGVEGGGGADWTHGGIPFGKCSMFCPVSSTELVRLIQIDLNTGSRGGGG